jgi:hypothetical protein
MILGKDEDHQRWLLRVNGLQFSIPFGQCKHSLELGKEVDLFIRPEEVMILRDGKPVKESLRRNMFEGEILDSKRKIPGRQFKPEGYPLRSPFPIRLRNLGLSVGKSSEQH